MSFDLFLRKCPSEAARAALVSLDASYPEVQIAPPSSSADPGPYQVAILDVDGVASITIGDDQTLVSGRGAAGPVIAWLTAELHGRAGTGEAWDPQQGAPLADPPDWDAVLDTVLMWELEAMEPLDVTPIGPDPNELAARFLALLLERELIELAPGDPIPLVEAVRVVLDAPAEQRTDALDALLMKHPGIEEVHGDVDDLARALLDWG